MAISLLKLGVPIILACLILMQFKLFLSQSHSQNETSVRDEPYPVITAVSNDSTVRSMPTPAIQGVEDDGASSMAACLLTMDDNHRLDEWIAFHWYSLPLRYLVVLIDPRAKTSPSELLEKWRPWFTEIIEWTDTDHTRKNMTMPIDASPKRITDRHRWRQANFYAECARHLQQHNRTWATFHDGDEFLTLNSGVMSASEYHHLIHQPGSILKVLKQYTENETTASGTEQEQAWHKHFTKPCVSVPRYLYSAMEDISSDGNYKQLQPSGIPIGLNVSTIQFDTLRFRYRAKKNRTDSVGNGKSIIDVRKIPKGKFVAKSAHRPVTMCNLPWGNYQLPIGIHHYLGSWESFSARSDARSANDIARHKVWKARSYSQAGGADDETRPWLQGFVNEVGLGAASALLSTAGHIPLELQRPTLNYTESVTATSK